MPLKYLSNELFSSNSGNIDWPVSILSRYAEDIKRNLQNFSFLYTFSEESDTALSEYLEAINLYINETSEENAKRLFDKHKIANNIKELENLLGWPGSEQVKKFVDDLPSIYWQHQPGIMEILGKQVIKDTKVALKAKQEFASKQMLDLEQCEAHPLINYQEGFCHGLALQLSYDILESDTQLSEFNTVKQLLEHKDMLHFEACQASGDIPYLVENGANICLPHLMEDSGRILDEYISDAHTIIPKDSISSMFAYKASEKIAGGIKAALEKVPEGSSFAMCLELGGNHKKTTGHDIAIVVKDNKFYFIDANVGIFSFDNLDEFRNFVAWELNQMKYCHVFSQFSLVNFPEMQSEYPIPKELLIPSLEQQDTTKKLSDKGFVSLRSSSSYDFVKDKLNELYTGQAIIQDKLKNAVRPRQTR